MKGIVKTVGYCLYLIVVTVVLLELILRIYNPIPYSVKGNKIILKSNQRYFFKNETVPGLDSEIVVRLNSLGFRGPDKPANYDSCLSIITVGGSTTFCLYVSENKTWPYLLSQNLSQNFWNVWLNNAGLNGQSSFGHIILMRDYIKILRPKVVIFLTGLNDIGRNDLRYDTEILMDSSSRSLKEFLLRHSETFNLILNILRNSRAWKYDLSNVYLNLRGNYHTLDIPQKKIDKLVAEEEKLLTSYGDRMNVLIRECLQSNIYPILMTQPSLGGELTDSLTGVYLGNLQIAANVNTRLYELKLNMYNEKLKEVCKKWNVPCIDLAKLMPKNSRYYFDHFHHNNEGCKMVSDLISPYIIEILKIELPQHAK